MRINLIYDIDPILKAIKKYTKAKQKKAQIENKISELNEMKKLSEKKEKKFKIKLAQA